MVRPAREGVAAEGRVVTRREVAPERPDAAPLGEAGFVLIDERMPLACGLTSPLVRRRGLARLGVEPVLPP